MRTTLSTTSSLLLRKISFAKKSTMTTTTRRGSFGRTNSKNSSQGECELVECEVDFGFADDEKDALTKACVANINGNTIDASALRNATLLNSAGNLEKLPLTGDKDVVVYLRHLG